MNDIFFSGRLTRDAEFRAFANGRMVARVSIANNRIYNKADGTQGNETTYLEVDVFAKSFDNVRGMLTKGQAVSMHGRLRCEEWIDKNGQKRSKLCAICSLFDLNIHAPNAYGGGSMEGGYAAPQQNGGGMPAFQMGPDGGYGGGYPQGGGYGGGYAQPPQPQQPGAYQQYPQQMPPPQGQGVEPQYQPQQAGAAQYQPAEQPAPPQPPPQDDNTPF